MEICSLNYARIPDDAAQNGNFSLELPKVHPKQDKMNFSLFFSAGENESTELCTLCLRVAGLFLPHNIAISFWRGKKATQLTILEDVFFPIF